MKYRIKTRIEAGAIAALALISAGTASAASTVDSSSFTGAVGSTAITTTGLYAYGYVSAETVTLRHLFAHPTAGTPQNSTWDQIRAAEDNTGTGGGQYDFTGAVITTSGGTYAASNVHLLEHDTLQSNIGTSGYTFDGNTAYGGYGSFGGNAPDIWTMTFNDLGVGTYDITLYMDHTSDSRVWDMDYTLTGGVSGTTTMTGDTILSLNGGTGSQFAYNISVTTTGASDDLTLTLGSVSGGGGAGFLAGYTVSKVPEPSTALLGALGVLFLLRRRRI